MRTTYSVLILFVLLFTGSAGAQKTLGRESFQVNVRPVLNGILGDFYQMVENFPQYPKEISNLIRELETLSNEKEELREFCPRTLTHKCEATVKALRTKLSAIRLISMTLMSKQGLAPFMHLSSVSGYRLVAEFDEALEAVKGSLDNASILLKAQIPEKRETSLIIKQLDELSTLISLALVEYIPYLYKDDFRQFYFDFVNPLQQQISKARNFEFMNRNVEALNFALNLLNQNLTKRNKKTPEGMASYLSAIHNRWNSVLRFYY